MSDKLKEIVSKMPDPRLIMYIVTCHVDKPLGEQMPDSIYYVPIQAGAALTDKRVCDINDYDGFEEESISDRNQRYSEMTAMHWAGKHIETPYVGIIHYRRRFLLDDNQLKDYLDKGFDIITTEDYPLENTVNDNYRLTYYGYDWDILWEILERDYPEYVPVAKEQFELDTIHPCNLNIFKSSVYEEYCNFVFPILDELYERCSWKKDTYQRRDIGFMGERLSSLFVEKKRAEGAAVYESAFRDLRSKDWTPADECDLSDFNAVYNACEKYYALNNISRCRNLVAAALVRGAIEDERIRDTAFMFKAALSEQRYLSETIFEYLPDAWKKDIATLRSMYAALSGMVKMILTGSEESIDLYREFLATTGISDIFLRQLCQQLHLSDEQKERIVELSPVHDPIVIIDGSDICNGILKEMAHQLGKAYEELGEKVLYVSSENSDEMLRTIIDKKNRIRFFIGVQALVLNNDYFNQMLDVPKIQLVVDNPAFIPGLFSNTNSSYYFFIHDYQYVDFVKKHYASTNVFYLPAGGASVNFEENKSVYDVSFVGSYVPPKVDCSSFSIFEKKLYEYLINNPDKSFENAINDISKENASNDDVPDMMLKLKNLCSQVSYFYRERIIQAILGSGIKIDVFGNTWEQYNGAFKENLIIHPAVLASEAYKVYNSSKLSLNIMSWHKAGLTERVMNIMMSNAVCISDDSLAISKEFICDGNGQQIVTYNLNEIEILPEKIKEILGNEERRKDIVANAHSICEQKHTWINRAQEIYQTIVENMS